MKARVIVGTLLVLPFLGILLWGFGSFARDAIRRRDAAFFLIIFAGLAFGVGTVLLIESLVE